jgi:serine/threonine-protein kinase HipA
MTPLYDVISAHPLMAQGSLTGKRTKMAMSLKGKNRHYHWQRIEPRHFNTTARLAGFSPERVKSIMAEIVESTEYALSKVMALLPKAFPEKVCEPIVLGARNKVREIEMYLQD